MHAITASYNGDSAYAPTLSPTVNVTVQDFVLSVTSPLDIVIDHGGTATYTLSMAPIGGSGLAAPVSFAVTGAPDNSIIHFAPGTVASGSGTTQVVLTVQTPNYPMGPWSAANTKQLQTAQGFFWDFVE